MASLAEYRAKYPQYDDLSDQQLADGLHQKYYADIPKEEFYGKLGLGGEQPRAKMGRPEAALIGATDAVSMNNTDEIAAPMAGASVRASRGDVGGFIGDLGQALGNVPMLDQNPIIKAAQMYGNLQEPSGVESATRDAVQAKQKQAFEDRPATYIGSQVAATAALPAASGERGMSMLPRTALAALEGGSLGAKYAQGAAEDADKGDLGKLGAGAGWGAAAGAGGSLASPLVAWGGKAAINALARLSPEGGGASQTNALFGAFDNGGRPRPAQPTVRQGVRENVVKSAVRSGLTPENIGERVQPWREQGVDPLTAQALGEPGLQRAQTLSSLPGKTPQLAAETIKGVRDRSPTQILDAVDQAFPITSKLKAQDTIENGFNEASEQYNKVLGSAKDEDVVGRMNEIAPFLQRMPDSVIEEAQTTMANLARYDGLEPASMNLAQQLHYFKRALGQTIKGMKREGLQADEARSLTRLAQAYTKKLDDVIPGYAPVRERWGDLSEAESALEWADDFFGKARPDELKADFDEMTPFQKENALIGIANELKRKINTSTKEGVRKKNIAEQFLNKEFADKLKSVVGPDADRLVAVLNLTDRDFNELSSLIPRGNSKTISVFGDMIDQAQATPPVNKSGIIDTVVGAPVRYGWRKATNALLESSRNKEGAEMYAPFTPEKQTALEEALRQFYANRSLATGIAGRSAQGFGSGAGTAAGQ